MFKCRYYFEENVIMIYLLTLFLIDGYIMVIINNIDINNVSNIMTTATSFMLSVQILMNVLKVYQVVVMIVKTVLDILNALAPVVSLCHIKITRHA